MALMVIASPLSCFRPPPDPPPYESPLFEDLSPIAPPEPPYPPDAVYVLVPLQIPNTSAKPSLQKFTQTFVLMLACPTMVTELNGSGAYLVSAGNTPFAYGRLFPVIYRFNYAYYSQLTFILVEWVGIQVCDLASADAFLSCIKFSFWCCDLVVLFSVAVGRETLGISHLVNMVLMDIDFSVVSWLEHFIFPKFPLVWSELEAQALLVLQGSFSQLMLFSAFGAEMVILWITLDATVLVSPLTIARRVAWRSIILIPRALEKLAIYLFVIAARSYDAIGAQKGTK
ncbi:hypothetical protein Bca4012_035395 [Brassica carinata]